MPKRYITRSFKTTRPITDSELLNALKNSMSPIFTHLEEELLKSDGKQLDIQITVNAGKISLKYGVGNDVSEPPPESGT